MNQQKATLAGKVIQHELISREMRILNPPKQPTYLGGKHPTTGKEKKSIIDYAIARVRYNLKIEEITPKDHRMLVVNTNNYIAPKTILKRPSRGPLGQAQSAAMKKWWSNQGRNLRHI